MKLWIIDKILRDGFDGSGYFVGAFTYKPSIDELVKLLGISEQEATDLHKNKDSNPKSEHYETFYLDEVDANTVVR
jgi:hypothetical protein